MRTVLFIALICLAAGCGKPRAEPRRPFRPAASPQPIYHIGSRVEHLTLADVDGTSHALELLRGRAVVLEFWSPRCPYVRQSEPARRQWLTAYLPRGVAYFAVDSNLDETPGEMKDYLTERGSSYTVVYDPRARIARCFNATRTTLAVVLDREGVVRYVGGVCSPEEWSRPPAGEPRRMDWLESALDAVLAGNTPDPPMRPSHGCRLRTFPLLDGSAP
ncbi:MAG: redoxin family protein [Candidatus Sumerlaeia bacterium]|nr:redoxin family protein [Candidatus Sumerlaeia bacterium]